MSKIKEPEPPEGESMPPDFKGETDAPKHLDVSESTVVKEDTDVLKYEADSSDTCKIDIEQMIAIESQDVNGTQSETKSDKCEDDKSKPQSQDTQIPKDRKRNWEVFPGGNKFLCNGRIIRAPEYVGYLISLALILITGALFFGFDCVYLTQKVGAVIPAIGAPIFLSIIVLLHRTTFSDPGIIPRATPDEIEKEEPGYVPLDKNLPRYTKREIKGRVFQLPYCVTCKLYRPPRASHCSTCDNCVLRFDHHCPVVSNCIGERNYRYFYLLVMCLTLISCYVIGCNVAVIYLRTQELGTRQAFMFSIPSLIESFICLGGLVSGLVCLAGIHSRLVCSEQTTHEMCRGTFSKKANVNNFNPYSHGRWYLNCLHILCSPSQPSLIDRRGFVDTEVLDSNAIQQVSPV